MATKWSKGGGAALLALAGLSVAGRALRGAVSDLQGQVALITGGSRGLGLLLAREFGHTGCSVAICARDAEELERAQDWLRRAGLAEVQAVVCDMTDAHAVERMVAEVTARHGRIDILINNAGIIMAGPTTEMTRQDYQRCMDLMFWGVYNGTEAVLPQMLARGRGRIANITSVGGKVSVPHLLPYCCAKFAATAYSEGLHGALARKGITVTTIAPGEMRTGSFEAAEFKGHQEQEFSWFAGSDSLPFLSLDAERAARQIVAAVKQNRAERILGLPAQIGARFNGLFPATTSQVLTLVDRMLPREGGDGTQNASGKEVQSRIDSPTLDTITGLGDAAAERFNEQPAKR